MTTRKLVRGGRILSLDRRIGELPRGDVLIEDGTILAVGHEVRVPDAEVIDASNMLVLPGFVDTHRHTWQSAARHRGADWTLADYRRALFDDLVPRMRPEDVYAGASLSAFAALDSGITTLVDWSHIQNSPAHADAAIDALRGSGIRAVFAHGRPGDNPTRRLRDSTEPHPADLRRLRERFPHDDGLITLAMAARGPAAPWRSPPPISPSPVNWACASPCMSSAPTPASNGCTRPGCSGRDLTLVHVTDVSDEALNLMAAHGVSASVAPQIERTMSGPRPARDRAPGGRRDTTEPQRGQRNRGGRRHVHPAAAGGLPDDHRW